MASGGDKFVYFLAGGFIGAAVALLFAPKSGEETRRFLEDTYKEGTDLLSKKANEGKDMVSETSRELASRVTDTINKGKESLDRQKDQISAAVEAGKEAYGEARQNLEGVSAVRTVKKRKSAS